MTAFDNIYAAAKAIMADVNTAASGTVTQATTNYGLDIRITAGEARYQVQLSLVKDFPRSSNDSHPRAVVKVLIHHYVTTLANEEAFLHNMMSYVKDKLTVGSIWAAEASVFGLQETEDLEPEISDAERVGNVITFEVSAIVLADAI